MNKSPWRITFDTNPHLCNLNCIMCEEHSEFSDRDKEKKGIMPFEIIEKVVAETSSQGLKEIIPSTMGEPLLYKDFDKIIDLCNRFNLKMNLTTNGTFPGKKMHEWAELLIPVCSDIKISWNGSTKLLQESIMIGSNFENMNENLKVLLKVRDEYHTRTQKYCSVTLQATFMKTNVDDLTNLAKKCIDLGIDRFKGHHLWIHSDKMKDLSMIKDKEGIIQWNDTVKELHAIVNKEKLPNGKKLLLDNFFELDESNVDVVAEKGECPFLCNEAWINWEGRFDPCCAPDNDRKKLGSFGSVKDKSLLEIWNSPEYKKLVLNYPDKELCRKCRMRRKINGS